MKRRTHAILTTIGRFSTWTIGLGLILIGEGLNCVLLTIASEREQ